jgi:hypothetical protein
MRPGPLRARRRVDAAECCPARRRAYTHGNITYRDLCRVERASERDLEIHCRLRTRISRKPETQARAAPADIRSTHHTVGPSLACWGLRNALGPDPEKIKSDCAVPELTIRAPMAAPAKSNLRVGFSPSSSIAP